MSTAKPALRRCAIYSRKSTDEGLEQDFNSLDAQHEACEAYIRSQAGEGWKPVPTRYDDGGYSGGTIDRPALTQLLADIHARKVDTVVVYKVDRLTRSLADFAKIVEVFDSHGVSFVSITQQFNTTTSMGRLTLNMLLSFAQFEREVTGERIRDKIAASKRKGMWMGGIVPLGYEPQGRTLIIYEAEAETVRTVFRLYLELGNVRRVKEVADRLGLTTKVRTAAGGQRSGGRLMSRGYIYKLLGNPLYAGRIAHKGRTYEGLHSAIIDEQTWNTVQAMLAGNTPERSSATRTTALSPLMGKLFDETGAPLTPSHALKSGRRYRYYISRQQGDGRCQGWRLAAQEIERAVADAVTGLLDDRSAFLDAMRTNGMPVEKAPRLLDAMERWQGDVLSLVERVDLDTDKMALHIDIEPLVGEAELCARHVVPLQLKRRGIERRVVLDPSSRGREPDGLDPALIRVVVRAREWFDALSSGRARTLGEIAHAAGCHKRYVGRLLPLAFLAPDIVEAILDGRQPVDLTAESLTRHTELPLSWDAQKVLLGFD